MSRSARVALSTESLAEIERYVAQENNPLAKVSLRVMLTKQAHDDEAVEALRRKRTRESFKAARAVGDPHAGITAKFAAKRAAAMDVFEARKGADQRRLGGRLLARLNRLHKQTEAASKTASSTARRFPQRDFQYLEIIGKATRAGGALNTPLVRLEIKKKLKEYKIPIWEKTSPCLKVMAMSVWSHQQRAQTINLRPNPRIVTLALQSPRGPASYIQDRIKKEFKRAFGNAPEFWFVIETDSETQFHVHGAVVTPNAPNAVTRVDTALRAAGGGWASKGGHQHQQISKELHDPIWWAWYACKGMNLARTREIERKLFASSLAIRSAATSGWDALRATLPT